MSIRFTVPKFEIFLFGKRDPTLKSYGHHIQKKEQVFVNLSLYKLSSQHWILLDLYTVYKQSMLST